MSDVHRTETNLVDVHAHILPGIDDGARDLEESESLLRASFRQGVRHIWATPHFNPGKDNPAVFLAQRAQAAALICRQWQPDAMPAVYLGAEVYYFYGIGRCEAVRDLCLSGTEYILVEMPETEWTPDVVNDLLLLHYTLGLKPIIAHVERCIFRQSKKVSRQLVEEGILFQSNARFLGNTEEHSREIKTLLKEDMVDLIASDCHNMRTRKPNLPAGLQGLEEMAGSEKVASINRRALAITKGAVSILPGCERKRLANANETGETDSPG
jgi:protein-tyrosine phosphatase